uniref:Uncharacterized protein n=1 Tax=Rangifer tarandus platyrhynchus TaxID=3082113 RepID=A0ACB0FFR3_RANTA|nr:unnamed protein product [Rangifer tarandus platyrhynchus]
MQLMHTSLMRVTPQFPGYLLVEWRTSFLPLSSNSVHNTALRALGKLALQSSTPPKGWELSRGGREHPEDTLSPPAHTPNKNPAPSCLAADDSVAPASSARSETEEFLVASGRQTGNRRPPDPSRELQLFTWVPAAVSGVSGAQHGAHCPGGWCREDSGRRSPRQLRACWAAIYPGARPRPRPLPEYWAIRPATGCPGSRRPLPPPSSAAAAAAATWREGAGPSRGLHLLALLLLGKLFPVLFPPASLLRGTLASLNRL